MAASRRMTRQVQIGLSHSDKAKKLSFNGFYEEALKELNIALRAFETENRDGAWNDAVAGVLNNAGFVYLFLGNYQSSEDTFKSAMAIKGRLGDQRSLIATLIGLSDACRGLCQFDESATALAEALDIAMALKDNELSQTIMANMDRLERTRCNQPDVGCEPVEFDELNIPSEAADITARVADICVKVSESGELMIEVDIGFPYLMKDLSDASPSGAQHFPCMALLFPKGIESRITRMDVTDEEEHIVGSSVSSFDGIVYGPNSYHREGPLPMPACKQYVYTHGAGNILSWDVTANGWYHIEAGLEVTNIPDILRLAIVIPFGTVRLSSVTLEACEQGLWSKASLLGGTFVNGRTLDTAIAGFSKERTLYEGSIKDIPHHNRALSLKYGILNVDLIK